MSILRPMIHGHITSLIFGGANDVWREVPLGEYVYEGWNEEQLCSFRPDLYDIQKMWGHPDVEGQQSIANQVIVSLEEAL